MLAIGILVFLLLVAMMAQYLRPLVALSLLFVAIYLADVVGIVSLIGQGYAYSSYLFLAIVVLPLLTRGIWLIVKRQQPTI